MESLTGDQTLLNIGEITPEAEKKPVKSLDRISISREDADRIDGWLKQIQEASRGLLSISRSDLISFLIRSHRDELMPAEIKRIKVDHYDPVKHIRWIMPQIQAALAEGNVARVSELQTELRSIELSLIGPGPSTQITDAVRSGAAPTKPRAKPRPRPNKRSDSVDEETSQMQPV